MEITKILSENRNTVNAQLEKFLPRKITSAWISKNFPAGSYDEQAVNNFISKPVWNFLDRGGKRWRPLLMFLSIAAVGGNPKQYRDFAVIPELMHNGTLMVDDVEDKSEKRRGKPALHLLYGQDTAINLGNLLYYLPTTIIKNSKVPSTTKLKLYETINDNFLALGLGQGTDIYWHNNTQTKVSEDQYFTMCANKTGTLARLSAQIGAILGGGSDSQIKTLGKFAESIGIAFQIQDDILNLEGTLGKDQGEDITEAKLSLPVIHTLNVADAKDRNKLFSILKKHSSNKKDIQQAIGIINKYGSVEYSRKVESKIITKALADLSKNISPSKAKEKLSQIAEFMIDRKN